MRAVEIIDRSPDVDIVAIITTGPPVDIAPSGHQLSKTWRAVIGATGAHVDTAVVSVVPATEAASRSLGVVASGKEHVTEIVIQSPAPSTPIRAISIPNLVRHDGENDITVDGQGALSDDLHLHLVLTPIVGGVRQAPVIAVPPLPRKNALPPQLTGGSLSGSLFQLPDVIGAKFRVTLVHGDTPEDFDEREISHGDVTLYAAPVPVGLHVDDPTGSELYALAGPIVTSAEVDVSAALNRHLGSTAPLGSVMTPTVTVRSDVIGKASVGWSTTGGVIERSIDGRLTADVDGARVVVPIPPPHPGRDPIHTVADVTVTHHGAAIHPISDPVPTIEAGQGGPTVRDVAVSRTLPAEALRGQVLRRVGVIGWPRGQTDLTLEVLGARATVESIAPPIDRDPPVLVWFDVGDVAVDSTVEVKLTATRGAFGWIADPEPLVRLAIAVSPQGERVTVGGRTVDLTDDETVVAGATLAGTDAWIVDSDQFCTVSIANAVMRFSP